jgi:hypothetical protein
MIRTKRTRMDLMNDIYSLAFWMTGSESSANELVYSTYLNVDSNTTEREVFKTFRECYFQSIDENMSLCEPESPNKSGVSLRYWFANIKLSILLSEIPRLKHRDISKIIGKPLDTIRFWLSTSHQSFADGTLSLGSDLPVRH